MQVTIYIPKKYKEVIDRASKECAEKEIGLGRYLAELAKKDQDK